MPERKCAPEAFTGTAGEKVAINSRTKMQEYK
jgi:hypothetical protein